jgi:UDP-glucuronate decarboxylase
MHPYDGRVVSNFILQALQDEPITIYGDGSQTRSFCYVDDLIEGMVRFMETGQDCTGPMNLGNPVEISIGELAREIIEQTGSRSEILYRDLPEDDPRQRKPDIDMAKETLRWEPRVPLAEGLKHTIAYFRAILFSTDRDGEAG